MSHPCDFPLGCVEIGAAQSIKKAWDACNLGHRVVDVNVDWNISDHTYDSCGKLTKVEYFHESNAESTKVTLIADSCCSLNGKSFDIFSKDDALRYNILYSVDCGTCRPADTCTIRYILVDIKQNDFAYSLSNL